MASQGKALGKRREEEIGGERGAADETKREEMKDTRMMKARMITTRTMALRHSDFQSVVIAI